MKDKRSIVKTAIKKVCGRKCPSNVVSSHGVVCLKTLNTGLQFRAAIALQFDFHRAIYNLGTVLVLP